MHEMKKGGCYGIGFIDPNTVNQVTWSKPFYKQDTKTSFLEFLKRLNINRDILVTTSGESHCLVLQILFLLTS